MKAGVVHCRCSRCFSLPSKRRLRKRPQVLGLLSLPEDVLLHIIKCLPAEDILSMRAVSSHFRFLVDNHTSVWACTSFREVWPSPDNLWLFERAAESGNFEGAVKLGIAYLYNEGLSVSDEGRAEVNGLKASRFLSLAESLNVHADPFVWLFIRPPWSPTGSCCKAVVYESLRTECQSQSAKKGPLLYCLAKVLSLVEDDEKQKEAISMFRESSRQCCLPSAYLIWEHDRERAISDPGRNLQSLRQLRDCAVKGCWEAQLSLAKVCGNGNQLGLDPKAAHEVVSQIFQSSSPCNKQSIFTLQKGMNDTMRYILIDWLVEVATMKDYSSLCLHVTVGCVDRYLMKRPVPRAKLQLLGIACMVICTRFISKEILTIREAVWLTDNTYKYEDLVRMMGEIISALEGKIQIPTVVDYVDVLLTIALVERRTAKLCYYICELSLLYTGLSVYSPALIAAAAMLLARILHRQALPWSSHLTDCTGFTHEDLIPCILSLHKKCFYDDAPKDYRQVSLTAVRQRFEDERYEHISREQVMNYRELCDLLGVKMEDQEPVSPTSVAEIQTFLSSPCGNKTKRKRDDSIHEDRGSFVATPTAELSSQEETLLGDFLDWSLDTSCSGYEGDQESEGEREGDVTAPSGILDMTVVYVDPEEHCCHDSSDEDSLPEEQLIQRPPRKCTEGESEADQRQYITFRMRREPKVEPSSGYSSVCSGSPASITGEKSLLPPHLSTSGHSPSVYSPLSIHVPWNSQSVSSPHAERITEHRGQVKRKNAAEHNEEELNLGFLNL